MRLGYRYYPFLPGRSGIARRVGAETILNPWIGVVVIWLW